MRERRKRGTRLPWLWVRERRRESEGAEMKTLDLKTQTLVLTKMGFVYIYMYAVVFRGFVIAPLFYGILFPTMPRVLNPMCIHGLLGTWNNQAQFGPHNIGKGKNTLFIYLFIYQILDFPKCNYQFFF